jgi:hypothetical protein
MFIPYLVKSDSWACSCSGGESLTIREPQFMRAQLPAELLT